MHVGTRPAPLQLEAGLEPIPGYVLEECVGAGGYGQVWRAAAPGGLFKALKFVFGQVDESYASRELKSLERVKQLQHPFLLSLERIELVQGQLVIVTELAQCSLRERFQECVKEGQQGVARDELLTYLRHAAEALDYLEQESLQHLDVKPENLLLVGGHVKVSDFGLIKDLKENVSVSLIDGLTPKYSPPELFDNRPSRKSDQYSLALVYQEMLTGRLPFDGVTAAQLATQHLNGKPDVSPSPPADRFALTKALSKDPEQRFKNCSEFVNYLLNPPKNASVLVSDRQPSQPPTEVRRPTSEFNDGQTMPIESPPATDLPPLDLSTHTYQPKPTLILGVGGGAAKTIDRVRGLLNDRFGGVTNVPAVQMLLLDTDVDELGRFATKSAGWPESAILPLPLRDSGNYRQSGVDGLESISRRWLYNIPRSKKTEGLRALGRLAFLDHSSRILDRLRHALRTATDAENVSASSAHTGSTFVEQPVQVFVVANISGGTGSGIVLDLGYAIRQVLADLCLSDEGTVGLLMHHVPTGASAKRDLAIANSYTCLKELQYFTRVDTDYPGEPSLGLAGFQGGVPAFDTTYVLAPGCEDAEEAAYRDVADYLYLNCATRAGMFFDAERAQTDDRNDVRTFGVQSLANTSDQIITKFAHRLSRKVLTQWRGGPEASVDDRPAKLADMQALVSPGIRTAPVTEEASGSVLEREHFTVDGLHTLMDSLAAEILDAEPVVFFERLVQETMCSDSGEIDVTRTLEIIDSIFGDSQQETLERHVENLRDAFAEPVDVESKNRSRALVQHMLQLAKASPSRLEGAQHGVRWTIEQLSEMRTLILTSRSQNDLKTAEIREQLTASGKQPARNRRQRQLEIENTAKGLVDYGLVKLLELQLFSMCQVLQAAAGSLSELGDDLASLWETLSRLRELFPVESDVDAQTALAADDHWHSLLALEQDLANQLDEEFGPSPVGGGLSFERLSLEDDQGFANELRQAARQFAIRALREIQGDLLRAELSSNQFSSESYIGGTEPGIGNCGGHKRMLLVTSEQFDAAGLASRFGDAVGAQPTVIKDGVQDFFLCAELGGLTLNRVANNVLQHRADLIETAFRLRARVNIDLR